MVRHDTNTEEPRLTKGERTRARILDIAENLFAEQGYDGTTLRQIAEGAELQEPGLYNHFRGKQALYAAVLERALAPMAEALQAQLSQPQGAREWEQLPLIMTDLLLEHPQIPALFQQALRAQDQSQGAQMMRPWLRQLFRQGKQNLQASTSGQTIDEAAMAINIIAMFNLTTGYFLAQQAFDTLTRGKGKLTDADNLEHQKRLLRRMMRAALNPQR